MKTSTLGAYAAEAIAEEYPLLFKKAKSGVIGSNRVGKRMRASRKQRAENNTSKN